MVTYTIDRCLASDIVRLTLVTLGLADIASRDVDVREAETLVEKVAAVRSRGYILLSVRYCGKGRHNNEVFHCLEIVRARADAESRSIVTRLFLRVDGQDKPGLSA